MKCYDPSYVWMDDFVGNSHVFCSSLQYSRLGAPEVGELFKIEGSKHIWEYVALGKAKAISPTGRAVICLLEG